MDWIPVADEKQARYESSYGDRDERAVVRRGNAAYAAGLALLMAGDARASFWLRRAAACWRESWDLGSSAEAWGRPVGALKACLLAGDDACLTELAPWTLGLESREAISPIGRYAATLALLCLGEQVDAQAVADTLRGRDDFPRDVADALAALGAADGAALAEPLASVVRSFETREEYLEDVAVADTALVLAELARRLGVAVTLPASPLLPV